MRILTIDLDWLLTLHHAKMVQLEKDDIPGLTENQFWQVIAWQNKIDVNEINPDKHKLIKLMDYLKQVAIKSPHAIVKVLENHHEIYPIANTSDALRITNIDLHHDILYRDKLQEEVDCGNWMYHLMRQHKVISYRWVRRLCSAEVKRCLFDPDKYCNFTESFNLPRAIRFDYIFIIKSPYYAPPNIHKLSESIMNYIYIQQEVNNENK